MGGQASREHARTERWAPDDGLVAAVRSGGGRHQMSELDTPDRCWLVAGLTLAGMTAEDIRDRLSCSLRLVRAIRAEPMTQLAVIYQREVEAFANEMRLASSAAAEHRRAMTEVVSERNKLKEQLDRVLDARLVGETVDACGKGHLMVGWNVYWHGGRRWCRECHAARQRDYRLARRLNVAVRLVRDARETGTLDEFVQSVLRTASTTQLSRHAATG